MAVYWNYLSIERWVLFIPESTEGVAEGKTTAMKQSTSADENQKAASEL